MAAVRDFYCKDSFVLVPGNGKSDFINPSQAFWKIAEHQHAPVLFMTGYLTQRRRLEGNRYWLAIPNLEIRELFVSQIREWFREVSCKDAPKLDAFCEAFPAGDAQMIEKLFNEYLWETISIRDTASAKSQKENFYHGILLGLLRHKEKWLVQSNAESGGRNAGDIEIWHCLFPEILQSGQME